MELCIFARHGESVYNVEERINGDPEISVALSDHGRQQAAELALHIASVRIAVCVHTRFLRTIETARLVLSERSVDVPFACEPLLDDIHAGDLEGRPMKEFAAWREAHGPEEPFPGGESVYGAAGRFAEGFRRLADRPEDVALAVCHELPIRFAINAASGTGDLERPAHPIANATAYLFERSALISAAAGIEACMGR
jgi:broad specificity phosphatase PhoE